VPALRAHLAQPGGDDGHAQLVAQAIVVRSAEDHVCVVGGVAADGVHRVAALGELEGLLAGSDQHQHALRTAQVDALQQRAGHGQVGGLGGTVRAAGDRGAHHRLAGLAHHRLHVFEVDVHQPRDGDDVADAAHGVLQHVVGVREGLLLRHIVAHHFEQLLV
jgi:hypothetical protein